MLIVRNNIKSEIRFNVNKYNVTVRSSTVEQNQQFYLLRHSYLKLPL